MASLVCLDHATILRGGEIALRDFSWTVQEGETWAITGPTGSGKTTLAEVLLGRHHVASGTVRWPFVERLRAAGRSVAWPSEVTHHVTFREESHLFSYTRHYYQQRFNFIEAQDDLTLAEFLRSGTGAADEEIGAAATQLGLGELLGLSLIKLSNGQTRRARIARALLSKPELLILDEPFMGLDTSSREDVIAIVGELIREGTRVLLITQSPGIPEWVTHVLELDRLTARWHGPHQQWRLRSEEWGVRRSTFPSHSPLPTPHSSQPVVELRNVNVSHGGRRILRDISWTVRAGERWAVLGPNGSGKTTLLSLLCGDHPQAYSNDVRLFGRRRGSGESIWEIKRNIGLVSPELHLYFTEPLTAARTAATGFFDVLAWRPTTAEQDAIVAELFDHFGITGLAERPFARLSTGEQRLVLFIRALVKAPPLLILDEPFQAFDAATIERGRKWLDRRLCPDQTLLFVTHEPSELPRSVDRRLRLEDGRVVELA